LIGEVIILNERLSSEEICLVVVEFSLGLILLENPLHKMCCMGEMGIRVIGSALFYSAQQIETLEMIFS
jgi:hypothetical protein